MVLGVIQYVCIHLSPKCSTHVSEYTFKHAIPRTPTKTSMQLKIRRMHASLMF